MSLSTTVTFGSLLRQLRRRAAMTQGDLAAAVGYSDSFISSLERNSRQPDVQTVMQRFVPALGLGDEPHLAARLLELAVTTNGDLPPVGITLTREAQFVISDTLTELPALLPTSPTPLIGREHEVKSLCNRLLGHSGRLLTLVGPPGIGKTRLGLAVADQLQALYKDGAYFVPLVAIRDPELVASTLAAELGIHAADPRPPTVKVMEFLRRKETLLLLDNFEQVISAAPLIGELLAACPGVRIVVTSRERLHLRAEQRYRVPPLEFTSAVTLFVQCAQALAAEFVLTPENQPTLTEICKRLDCLPLAIELIAAQMDLFTPQTLLAQLCSHRLDLLVNGPRDLPARHRTLRHTIDWSYALLNSEEQALFRTLGVFVGGFDLAAIAHFGFPANSLQALINKSLVRAETTPTGEQRFLLLETIREFALEQLHAQGEEDEMRQRHYLAYLHLFRTGDAHLRRAEATTWSARLEVEQDNLRAALQWTLAATRYADMAWLLLVASHFWVVYGSDYEGARWIARLLPHRQTLAVELRLAILVTFVSKVRGKAEFPSLDPYRAEIIDLMEVCPSKQWHSLAWHFLAQSDAEMARAYALAQEASAAPDQGPEFGGGADHEFVLAGMQLSYSNYLLHQGEVAQATLLVRDSLHRFRQHGNHAFIADSLGALGNLALLRGNIAEAHSHLLEVVTIGITHNLRVVAEWQWLLGLVTLYGGNTPEARRLLVEALRFCLEEKNTNYLVHNQATFSVMPKGLILTAKVSTEASISPLTSRAFAIARVCMALAETALWEGDLDQAAHWLGQSLAYHATPQRITTVELQRLFIAARLATLQGQYLRAATVFGLAEAIHRQIHHIYAGPMLPLVNAALSKLREALGVQLFDKAFAEAQQLPLSEAYTTIVIPASIVSTGSLPSPT